LVINLFDYAVSTAKNCYFIVKESHIFHLYWLRITARVRRIIVNDKLVWKERSSNGLENLGICMDGLLATVRNPAGYSIYGLNLKLATS
jgi:hypothetical protein